ncbi:hypothetical protein C0995_006349 [Termitomyces sp. Mi166|nr:hypothetical protein C0995_006349 [Termitomyces sp. Mi166\
MNRPATPENKDEIYKDYTVCVLRQPATVKVKNTTLENRLHCPSISDPHELPAGHRVTVFNAEPISLTGGDETYGPANTAYRIEGMLGLTVYESVTGVLTESNCSNTKLRKHSNLRPVSPPDCNLNDPFPDKTVVALREGTTFKGVKLPRGELFLISSKAKTPRGQGFRSRDPIGEALYDVVQVKEKVLDFKVKNSSNLLVRHKDLECATH